MNALLIILLAALASTPSTQSATQPASAAVLTAQDATLTSLATRSQISVTPATWPTIRTQLAGEREYIFADGVYDSIAVPAQASGSIFRARNPWSAEIVAPVHGIEIGAGASDITIRGFRVSAPRGTGVRSSGYKNVVIEYCWVRHAGQSGISGFHHSLIVRYCLVEFCGEDPIHDHGIYLGSRPMCAIENCIIRHNAGCGIGMALGSLRASIKGNLVHDNGNVGLLFGLVPISDAFPCVVTDNTLIGNGTNYLVRSNSADASLYAAAQSTTPCANFANNIIGRLSVGTANGQPLLITSQNNLVNFDPALFTKYFQVKSYVGIGWPKSNWPTITSDWSSPAIPYCGDPATAAAYPLSLMQLRN